MKLFKKFWMVTATLSLFLPSFTFALTPPPGSPTRLPFIRLYNPTINDHFYTTSRDEASLAQSRHGYRLEGELGWVYQSQQDGTEPIFRLWNPRAGKHFYTSSYIETQNAADNGFVREGHVGFILAPAVGYADILLYRMYNPSQQKHFYTTDKREVEYLEQRGFIWEGQLGGGLYSHASESEGKPIFEATSDNVFAGDTYWVYPTNGKMVFEYYGPGATTVSYTVRGVPSEMTVEGGITGTRHLYRGDKFFINVNSSRSDLNGTLFVDLKDTFGNSSTINFEINGTYTIQ